MGKKIHFASDDDCRAIKKDGLLWKSLTVGDLVPLIELVKNKPDLELCFRRNSESDRIAVYYNNHSFLSYHVAGGKVVPYVSESSSRYFEDRIYKNKELKHMISHPEDYEDFYMLRKEVMDTYFDPCKTIDYEKSPAGVALKEKKDCKYEKQEQQKLMSANINRENGYYIYDMEYAQAFKSQELKDKYTELTKTEKHNKPDSLAIRYEGGKPVAMVFVELKTTHSAMTGTSSAINHIKGMRNYVNWDKKQNGGQFIRNRLVEAHEIMTEYQSLGIHKCGSRPIEDFSNLPVELLLVITGNEQTCNIVIPQGHIMKK